MNKPELPPGYTVYGSSQSEGTYSATLIDRCFEDVTSESVSGGYGSHDAASAACWDHWRASESPWVEYIDSLPNPDDLQREPFEGFLDVTPEHLDAATKHAENFAPFFADAGLGAVTPTHAILAIQLLKFGRAALEENDKPHIITRRLFDDTTVAGKASMLMLAALMQRLYSAPYDGLNVAAVDFIHVLIAIVELAASSAKPKLKRAGMAKGKRPQ